MPKLVLKLTLLSKDIKYLQGVADLLEPQFAIITEGMKQTPQVESAELDVHIEED